MGRPVLIMRETVYVNLRSELNGPPPVVLLPPPALHTWLISGWLVSAMRLNERSNITISKMLSSPS